MLESIVYSNRIYYIMGGIALVGILSKVVVGFTLKTLVKAASIMPKSPHSFMKLVRAKFEHACMVNQKVENIEVFVEKYIHEYHMLGLRLYSWQRLEKILAVALGMLTIFTAGSVYYYVGWGEIFLQKTGVGVALLVLLLGIYQLTDEQFKLQIMRMYMVDYLENVCARRYEKEHVQKEKIIIPELEKRVYGKKEEEIDSSEILQEQIANIKAKQEEEKLFTKESRSPIEEKESEEIRPTLSMVEKLLLEEAERRKEQKEQKEQKKQEEYMPNEATIREILQEFMA